MATKVQTATAEAETNRETDLFGVRILQGARERVANESNEAQCQFEAHDSHASHSSSDPDLNDYCLSHNVTASVFAAGPRVDGGKILERARVRVRDENARASSDNDHSSHSEHTDFSAHAQYAEE